MANFPVGKVDGNQLQPADWNQIGSLNNFITSTSQTPSDVDLNQIGKGSAEYAASSTFYTEGGIADAYVLTSVASLEAPESYVEGAEVRFRTANTNTGASTINVATSGIINIKQSDGTTDLTAGQISTTQDTILRYDDSLGVFIIPTNVIIDATTTNKGIVELLTDAELALGTDTTRAATAASLLSLFNTSSKAASGYLRVPINIAGAFSEIIMQWGVGTSNNTITFPLTFPTEVFNIQITQNQNSNASIYGVQNGTLNTAGFGSQAWDVSGVSVVGRDFNWLAIGH